MATEEEALQGLGRTLQHLNSKQAAVASAKATIVFNPIGGAPWHGKSLRIAGGGTCTLSIDGQPLEAFPAGINTRRGLPNIPIWHELRLEFVGVPSVITIVRADLWGQR